MEPMVRTTTVGKPEVYRQTRQKTRVLLVRCIILGLGTSANPQHDTYFPVQPQVSRQNLPCAMISTRSYYSIVIVSAQPISIVAWFNDVQRPLLVSVNYIHLVSSRMFWGIAFSNVKRLHLCIYIYIYIYTYIPMYIYIYIIIWCTYIVATCGGYSISTHTFPWRDFLTMIHTKETKWSHLNEALFRFTGRQ